MIFSTSPEQASDSSSLKRGKRDRQPIHTHITATINFESWGNQSSLCHEVARTFWPNLAYNGTFDSVTALKIDILVGHDPKITRSNMVSRLCHRDQMLSKLHKLLWHRLTLDQVWPKENADFCHIWWIWGWVQIATLTLREPMCIIPKYSLLFGKYPFSLYSQFLLRYFKA